MSNSKFVLREVLIVLTVKLLILASLWAVCFSHPLDKQLTSTVVSNHLINKR